MKYSEVEKILAAHPETSRDAQDDMQRGHLQKVINRAAEYKEQIEELVQEGKVIEADQLTRKLDHLCEEHPEVKEYIDIEPGEHSFMNEVSRELMMGKLDQYPSLIRVFAADPSLQPPRKWWSKMHKEVKEGNPDYSDEQIRNTIGDIWYHKLSEKKKKEIRGREGKKLGPAKEN